MSQAMWAEPALLWGNQLPVDRKTPQLLQLTSDDFLPEFLTAMKASPDKKISRNPVAEDFFNKWQMKNPKPNFTLYQPLHSRYYLVTASLVCHQAGLPDKEVNLKKGEKTYFVLRRKRGVVEQGWSETCGWFDVTDGKPCNVIPKEEQFPAHPVSVCTGKDGNVLPCERKIYYGYIATGNREKYLDKQAASTASTSPEEKIKQFFINANKDAPADQQFDQRLEEFDTKVIASRNFLINNSVQANLAKAVPAASLNILLDLIDIMPRVLPNVWKKIDKSTRASITLSGEQLNLYNLLNTYTISYTHKDNNNNTVTDPINLLDALNDLKPFVNLVYGDDTIKEPDATYDVRNFSDASKDQLKNQVKKALAEEQSTLTFTPKDAEERLNLIQNQVRVPIDGVDNSYFVRMVYEYDPTCPPIESDKSSPFTFARNLEPDAPARLIRIEMPSIKPGDLRKFRHGVGMQLSPELRKVMDGVHEGMLDKEGLKDSASWELGMICTFSIQIITLIAFILMFIIAIMLNIVFWWMAFLKICFPIPKKA